MEIIKLNLIPTGVNPTCHCSQYDEGRVIRIELFDGLTPYTLQSGDTVTLNVRKPDNTIVTTSVTATQGNKYVDIVTTEQICAVVGYNLCDLTITNGSVVIGTLNFIMQVERDVLADGIPSQSVIEDLDARVQEAVGDNYYTKSEVDSALDLKADKSTTYTKTEVDSALALKANSADVYTKTQADDLLDDKADKSTTYTKTETDALLALKADKSEVYNLLPTEQANGAVATFTDGADNIPVKSLNVAIEAIQAGSGDPSPSNIRSISGWNLVNVNATGRNILNGTNANVTPTENGLSIPTGRAFNYILYSGRLPLGYWTLYDPTVGSNSTHQIVVFNKNSVIKYYTSGTYTINVTDESEVYVLRQYVYAGNNDSLIKPQLERGDTPTEYEPFGYTKNIDLGQTVYGGSLNVTSGVLTITHGIVDLSTMSWSYASDAKRWRGIKSDMKNYQSRSDDIIFEKYETDTSATIGSENKGYISGAYIYINSSDDTAQPNGNACYPLATPQTVQLTPTEVKTLLGYNNIFADTGDVDVTIRADIGLYIDKKLGS